MRGSRGVGRQNVTDMSFCVDVLRVTNKTPCSVGNVSIMGQWEAAEGWTSEYWEEAESG